MVSLKRFVAVSEKAVQVEEEATPPQTESEKILYKCRKLSVGAKVQMESRRSSAFVQIREEPGEATAAFESEESRQKAARRENRLV